MIVFGDHLTGRTELGLAISLFGIAGYNYLRIQQKKERMSDEGGEYEELDLSDFELDHLNNDRESLDDYLNSANLDQNAFDKLAGLA